MQTAPARHLPRGESSGSPGALMQDGYFPAPTWLSLPFLYMQQCRPGLLLTSSLRWLKRALVVAEAEPLPAIGPPTHQLDSEFPHRDHQSSDQNRTQANSKSVGVPERPLIGNWNAHQLFWTCTEQEDSCPRTGHPSETDLGPMMTTSLASSEAMGKSRLRSQRKP